LQLFKEDSMIKDQTTALEICIPPEFANTCAERGLTPEIVLRGFIADLCALHNFVANPRADGYSSNGSDERMMAREWFDRAYFAD
jgi:hypothetical protein